MTLGKRENKTLSPLAVTYFVIVPILSDAEWKLFSKKFDIGFVGTEAKKNLRKVLIEKLKKKYPQSFFGTAEHTQMRNIYSASKVGFNYSINNDINVQTAERL